MSSRLEPMPRQRVHHGRMAFAFPDNFPRRLESFKEALGLSWAELARRVGTYPDTVRRWRAGVRPNAGHLMSLLSLSDMLGLSYLLSEQRSGRATSAAFAGHDNPLIASSRTQPQQATAKQSPPGRIRGRDRT